MEWKERYGFKGILRRTISIGRIFTGVSLFVFLALPTSRASAAETCPDGTSYCCSACHTEKTCGHAACDSCHGNPPTKNVVDQNDKGGLLWYPLATGSTSVGAHLKHATQSGMNYSCDECHKDGMQTPPVKTDFKIQLGFRGNGSKNYDGRPALNPPFDYAGTNNTSITRGGTLVCSNTYCHSNGTGGTANLSATGALPLTDPRPVAGNASPAWDTASVPLACNSCHGYPPAYNADQPKANAHIIHQFFTCDACHFASTADGTTITDKSKHNNGIYDLVPNTTKSFTAGGITNVVPSFTYRYDAGGGICSNVSCHAAKGMTGDRTWGVTPLGINTSWVPGLACYEIVFQNVSAYNGTPPYTYFWDFGDGTTSTVQNPTHVFPSGATYQVTVTARDANLHTGSKINSVTPLSGNSAPVSDFTVTAFGWTVTLTDLSYDPDYNTCGHSGPGSIEILWGDMYAGNPRTTEAINLTDAPSNRTYTHTYSTVAKITANIYENIRDNAGTLRTKSRSINIPTTYTVGGRVTRANGTGLSGAIVYFRTMSGANPPFGTSAAITDANGYYTISGTAVDGICYVVKKPEISGYTFTQGDQTVCAASSNVNFTSVQ